MIGRRMGGYVDDACFENAWKTITKLDAWMIWECMFTQNLRLVNLMQGNKKGNQRVSGLGRNDQFI